MNRSIIFVYRPQESYKSLFYDVISDLWNKGTCSCIQKQINEITKREQQPQLGDPYRIRRIEWQVYHDLYAIIQKNGMLPSITEEINCPDHLVSPDGRVCKWTDLGPTTNPVWSCSEQSIEMISEVLNKILLTAQSSLSEQHTNGKHSGIPIMTKNQNEPEQISVNDSEGIRTNNDHEEADKILQQTRKDAENTQQKAKDDAARILNEANDKATRILNEANDKATRILNEANDEATRILNEANQKKEQEAQQISQDLIRKYISSKLNQNWAEFHKSLETESETTKDALTRGERERKEIWSQVSSMQGDIVKAMEDTVAYITRIKQDLCHELGEWRSSLHVNQFDDIAKAYAGLFRVHEEMNTLLSITITSKLPEESIKDLSDEVERIRDNLGRIEKQMNRALSSFGMYPIQPEKGDPFDNERHELTDKQQDEGVANGEGYPIQRCVMPGVALMYDEVDREDKILRKAKVEVDTQRRE